jgi:hypothetical protein
MPRPVDLFGNGDAATSGPLKGSYLWSDPDDQNWTNGIPENGDAAVILADPVDDDLAALSLSTLTLGTNTAAGADTHLRVTGHELQIGTLLATTPDTGVVDANPLPGLGPVKLSIDTIGTEGMTVEATGAGARVVVQTAVAQTETFKVQDGGEIEVLVAPSSHWTFDYSTGLVSTIAFAAPAASNAMPLLDVGQDDVLEVPGTSVSKVVFGAKSLTVTTDAGVYTFTNVTYADTPSSYSASVDAVTGLMAITLSDVDMFRPTVKASSGDYLWSNPANWSGDVPVDGDNVSVGDGGTDDLSTLTLATLTLNAAGNAVVHVTGGSLTVASLTASGSGGSAVLDADAADSGAPVTVTVQQVAAPGASLTATGAGAYLLDESAAASDKTTDYAVAQGGVVELFDPPLATDAFTYTSSGTFAFEKPGGNVASLILGLGIGDTVEVPGTTALNVAFGANSLTITTDAGTFGFTSVHYTPSSQILGNSAAVDPQTGLMAITLVGPDIFRRNPYVNPFWSNASLWSRGLPNNGDNVLINGPPGGTDDIASLTLNSLTLLQGAGDFGNGVDVYGTLAIGTLYDYPTVAVEADSTGLALGLPADDVPLGHKALVTIGNIALVSPLPGFVGSGADLGASGAGATLVDQSATDLGTSFSVNRGGTVEITAAALSDISNLQYNTTGTFALWHPTATTNAAILDPIPGDVLELPGTLVTALTFGPKSLSVTTDAGAYDFTFVRYVPTNPIIGYTASRDAKTGLVAITFTGPDTFLDTDADNTVSPNYLWSNPANWTNGVPIDGDSVTLPKPSVYSASSIDYLPSLHLVRIELGGPLFVGGQDTGSGQTSSVTLSVDTLVAGGSLGVGAAPGYSTTVSVGSISGTGQEFQSAGLGSRLIVQSGADQGNLYDVNEEGFLELPGAVADASTLDYESGTIALKDPGAVTNAAITHLGPNYDDGYVPLPPDVLELPGKSVLSLVIGAANLDIVTDAGHYTFTNVTGQGGQPINDDGAFSITGYSAAFDATTGLVAITFTGPDIFEQHVEATSGPLAGKYLWSNAANWSAGVPIDGDSVLVADERAAGYDDLPTLTLASLSLYGSDLYVTGSSLTVGAVTGGGHQSGQTHFIGSLTADAHDAGAPVTVTAEQIADTDPNLDIYRAAGNGATFVDQSGNDLGEDYDATGGGLLELNAKANSSSVLLYSTSLLNVSLPGSSKIALKDPGATNAATLSGLVPGDVLELPGTSVSAATFGATSLSLTTDAGTYAFSKVEYDDPVTGYTAALDAITGLVAITFTGPDVFEQNVKATSGPLSGDYLWSNAANWSHGVPNDGDSVATSLTGIDDIASLSLSALILNTDGYVVVTGTQLTVGTLAVDGAGILEADAGILSTPVTVTVGAVVGSGAVLQADESQAILVDQSAIDPGEKYNVFDGGRIELLSAVPSSASVFNYYRFFDYSGRLATIALGKPAATNAVALVDIVPRETLELPGNSVSAVDFGANSLNVTTDAGTYAFSNVTYVGSVTGYTAASDPVDGLVAITFTGPDVFVDSVKGSSDATNDFYDWSSAGNWTPGIPIDGDDVSVTPSSPSRGISIDDVAALSLHSLILNDNAEVNVWGGSLTISTVSAAALSFLFANSSVLLTPVTVTVNTITGAPGGFYGAVGAGARFVDLSTTDLGELYHAFDGGFIELSAAPASSSDLGYGDSSSSTAFTNTIALQLLPAGTYAVALDGVRPGDVLELPGASIVAATFGASSLNVMTDIGAYAFTNVTYLDPVTGYTVAPDPTTGLVAITFTHSNSFVPNEAASSGPLAGRFLWSNAANWTGGNPADGDSVSLGPGVVADDDVAALALTNLTLADNAQVLVTGGDLTVATVAGSSDITMLIADAADAGGPVHVTVDAITGTGGEYGADGAGATFVDLSDNDPGETNIAKNGGKVELFAAPSDRSTLIYSGSGTFALHAAGATNAVAITDVTAGDVLELPGSMVGNVTFGTHSLSVTTDTGTYDFTNVSYQDGGIPVFYSTATDGATGLAAVMVNCFRKGTRIATGSGEVTVEHLRIGDMVRVVSGALRPIRWIATRCVDLTLHPAPATVLPVRVRCGAFGPGAPHRDLFLSPDHAVYVEAVLIPVKYLINGGSIRQIPASGTISYFHIELDRHDILLAEGLSVESYLDTDNRAMRDDGFTQNSPNPDYVQYIWEAQGYAPLVVFGQQLHAAKRWLATFG